ncbi:MAG: (2E,6E)-farnesyl diphosphate synthase [Pseudomonadota bacterium]
MTKASASGTGIARRADVPLFLARSQQRVEDAMARWLPPHADCRLTDAMRYSLFNGGKRFRPALTYAVTEALGADIGTADAPACAVEIIHSYSLVHDDLPAMDDDDLRRGKPTVHCAFDEATAILAGDALQTLAFRVMALCPTLQVPPAQRLRMIALLADASGTAGMAAGQMADIEAEGHRIGLPALERLHRLKTGRLIEASVELGALAAGCTEPATLAMLQAWAGHVGLAFQVQDDILDVIGDETALGKRRGADEARAKSTYPALLGLDGARAKAEELRRQAHASLGGFPGDPDLLHALADFVVDRTA